MVGLPVRPVNRCRDVLGEVKDLCVDPVRGVVRALLLAVGGIWRTKRLLEWSQIAAVEEDGLLARSDRLLRPSHPGVAGCWWLMAPEQGLFGRLIVDIRGEPIGRIGDVLIEPATGRVVGYELSDGMLQDLVTGRRRVLARTRLAREGERLQVQACSLAEADRTRRAEREEGG